MTGKAKKKIRNLILIMAILGLVLFLFFLINLISVANMAEPDSDYEVVIVLGAKVNGMSPSLALKYRLDKALEYISDREDIRVVVTGGKGSDEAYTESFVMKSYLINHGLDESRIIMEDKSTTTYQNLKNTRDMIDAKKVLVCSNGFHTYRAIRLAKKLGFDAYPLNAKTPDIIKIRMYIREILANIYISIFGAY